MQKKPSQNFILEFRNYSLPDELPAIALLDGQFSFPKSRLLPNYMHFHNCLEIGCFYSGGSTLAVEDRTFPVSAGDVILVPPYASHITYQDGREEEARVEYLYLDPVRMLEGFPVAALAGLKYFQHNSPDFPYVLHGGRYQRAAALLREILDQLRRCEPYYEDCVRGLTLLFMVELLRALPEGSSAQGGTLQSKRIFRLAAVVEYINDHYMEHIQPQTLADLSFMSLTSFRRLFKSVVGISPLEYIHHIRIRKAQLLLFSTEDSILDISLSVGFDSPSSFNRRFAEISGMSPLKWRNYCRTISKKDYVRSEFEIPSPSGGGGGVISVFFLSPVKGA